MIVSREMGHYRPDIKPIYVKRKRIDENDFHGDRIECENAY